MPLTPRTATPYPAASDAPDGPAQMAALALNLEKFAVPKFASAAARTSAIPTPTEGDLSYRSDLHRYEAYSSLAGDWVDVIDLDTSAVGPWQTPTLTAQWTPYGGGFAVPRFRAERGCVRCEGLYKTVGGVATGQPIFTLPTGLRPASYHIVVQFTSYAPTASSGATRVDVESGGVVRYQGGITMPDANWLIVNFYIPLG